MPVKRRILDLLESRAPSLARAIGTPAVRGATAVVDASGTLWSASDDSRALVVYLTPAPALSRWLAGSIALRVRVLVLVPDEATDVVALDLAVCDARARAAERGDLTADDPVAIVAEADTAAVALELSRRSASRVALLYPSAVKEAARGIPTTLIQAASSGPDRPSTVALERALRGSGTAVRETEYDAVDDGWARYPNVSSGSRRALDDLVAFLDRGLGEASTFDVIPGWDLH